MAITQIDGFDLYTAATGTGTNNLPLSSVYALSGTVGLQAGRFGGQCAFLASGGAASLQRVVIVPTATLALGMARQFAPSGTPVSQTQFLDSATAVLVTIALDATGALFAYRGAISAPNLLGSSAPGVILSATWQYVEVELVISDTVGVVNIYVDGAQVLALSNVDTKPGTTTTVALILQSLGAGGKMDDYYLTDTAAKLGEQKVTTSRASANTATAQWAPLTGASGVAMVLDVVVDGDTTYIFDATVGHKSLFDMANFAAPVPLAITAVQTSFTARKDDATTRQVRAFNVSGATTTSGATENMSASYVKYNDIYSTDPNTGAAWTPAAVDALQVGVEVVL